MNRWSLLGALLFGGLFALFAYFRLDSMDSVAIRGIASFFIVGFYGALVAFGTADKKRTLSLPAQTVLGVFASLAIAAVYSANGQGYALAAALGLILGFTADKWIDRLPLP